MAQSDIAESERYARYVLFASLADGRRVLDLGCGDGTGLLVLAQAGAKQLTAVTTDVEHVEGRLADSDIGVEIFADGRMPLPLRDGSVDLVICNDLVERYGDDERWLREIRRVLTPQGYLALAVRNAGGVTLGDLAGESAEAGEAYEKVYERLAPIFGRGTLFGQTPLVGSLFFDFESDDDEPGLLFDRSLVPDEAADAGWYVLVFGPRQVHRDDLVIVEAPFTHALEAKGGVSVQVEAPEGAADTDHGTGPNTGQVLLDQLRETEGAIDHAELLQARVAHGQSVIQQQESELAQLEASRRELEGEVATLRIAAAQRAVAQAALANSQRVLANQEDLLHAEVQRRQELEVQAALQLAAIHAESVQALDAGSRDAATQIEAAQAETAKAMAELDRAENETSEARAELEVAHQDNAKLRDELAEKENALSAASAQISAALERAEALDRELGEAKQALEAVGGEREALQGALEERVAQAKQAAEAFLEEMESRAQAELDQLKAAQAAAEQANAERFASLEIESRKALSEAQAEAQKQLDALQAKIDEAAAAHQDVDGERQQLRAQIEQLTAKLAELERSLSETKARAAEQLTEAEASAQEELERVSAELEKARAEANKAAAGTSEQLETLRAGHDEAKEKWAAAEQELQRIRQDNASYESQIQDLMNEANNLRTQAASAAQSQTAALETRLREVEVGSKQERQRADKLVEDLARLKMRLTDVEVERDHYRAQVAAMAATPVAPAPVAAAALEDTVVAAPAPIAAAPQPPRKTGGAMVQRDAVGRPVESTLDDLEDLLANAVPGRPDR